MKIYVVLVEDGDYYQQVFESAFDNRDAAECRANKLNSKYGEKYAGVIETDLYSADTSEEVSMIYCRCRARGVAGVRNLEMHPMDIDCHLEKQAKLIEVHMSGDEEKLVRAWGFSFAIAVANVHITEEFEDALEKFCDNLGYVASDMFASNATLKEVREHAIKEINDFLNRAINKEI